MAQHACHSEGGMIPTMTSKPESGALVSTGVERLKLPRLTLLDRRLRSSAKALEGSVRPRFRLHVAKKSKEWVGYIERRGGSDEALSRFLMSANNPAVRPPWASEVTWRELSPSSGPESGNIP